MVTLTEKFNTATVKKGEAFRIDLHGGGFVGATWKTQIVSGSAAALKVQYEGSGMACGPTVEHHTFAATDAGDVDILATEQRTGRTCTFKVRVN